MKYFILAIALLANSVSWADSTTTPAITYPANARYVLVQKGETVNQYLLDTQTGKVWTLDLTLHGPLLERVAVSCATGKLSFNLDCSDAHEVPGAP